VNELLFNVSVKGSMNVFLIAAISADGFIAQSPDQVSTAWTSKEDHTFFVQRTRQAGAMVFGSSTFRTFKKILAGRANIVYTRDIEKFRESIALEVVEITADTTSVADFTKLYATKLSPSELVTVLEKCGMPELAVCGGASVYAQFMQAGVVKQLFLTIEPIVFGKGVPLFGNETFQQLQLKNVTKLSEQTVLLEYEVLISG